MLTRRTFFKALGAVIAAAGSIQLVPGGGYVRPSMTMAEIDAILKARYLPVVQEYFTQTSPMLAYLKSRQGIQP